MTFFDFNTLPEYAEAVRLEASVRRNAFCPALECVCGVWLKPMTPEHVAILEAVGNAFVVGSAPTPADVGVFLWALSPSYSPTARFRRWRFYRSVRKLDFIAAVEQIERLVEDSFMDAPPSAGSKSSTSYCAWPAYLVDLMASEYGWTDTQTLGTPLKRLWQYVYNIRRRRNPDSVGFNPSDRIKGKWLRELNEQNKANQ